MTGFRSAVAFLTVLPVGMGQTGGKKGMGAARGWFPVVGLLIGMLMAGLDLLLWWVSTGGSPDTSDVPATIHILAAALMVGALAAITGALHLDGFMDTCDALLGGSNPDQRRAILKDPHVGAFAVVGVTCLLLIKVAAWSALPWPSRGWTLIVIPCFSRAAMLLVMETFPYVGKNGLGADLLADPGRGRLVFGLGFTVTAGMALTGPGSLAMLVVACLIGWLIGAQAARLLGGVTGDVYGAVSETSEAAALSFAVLITSRWPQGLSGPFSAMVEGWF